MLSINGDGLSRLFRRVVAGYPKTGNHASKGGGFTPVRDAASRIADYPADDLIARLDQVAKVPLDASAKDLIAQALAECGSLPLDTRISPFRSTIA